MKSPMIYVCVPTTRERRPRLENLIRSIRESDYPNITLVIHEGVHPGCVESIHALLEGINGLVFILSDDNEIYPSTISTLYKAHVARFPNNEGLTQPVDTIQGGKLPVTPFCHSDIIKKYFYKGYIHNFSDNELRDVLGDNYQIVDTPVEHFHVSRDRSLQDETYATNQRTYERDRDLYLKRKLDNFEPKNEA